MGVSAAEITRRRAGCRVIHPAFGIDPANWLSFLVFDALGDQWRIVAGFGGAYYQGIDYSVLPIIEKRLGVRKKQRARVFDDLREMVAAAKTVLNAV